MNILPSLNPIPYINYTSNGLLKTYPMNLYHTFTKITLLVYEASTTYIYQNT